MSAPAQPNLPAAKWALRGYAHTELGATETTQSLSFELSAYDLAPVLADGFLPASQCTRQRSHSTISGAAPKGIRM